ncbi:FAD-binding oxidoreductase [Shimia ponticola]|uniref:FAD-binding oxidoreductase n=1 Tax=Shimia ponticola TaxID=2582893 RepID=UPI0011BF5837|nr:FAD-binding oxidoreductase [Shimia ponticola]
MTHKLKLQSNDPITPDTYMLTFDKPANFDFEPGQAAELFLDKGGLRDEGRPFTMTSLPQDATLQFVIKTYPERNGITQHIPTLAEGDDVTLDGPFGAISDQGAGTFIAAGAGITPFIPILKKHAAEGVGEDMLVFSNHTEADIILKKTWDAMPELETKYIVTGQENTDHTSGKIDKEMLRDMVEIDDRPVYICGPGGFVDDVRSALKELGKDESKIITEDGW